MSDELKPCPFCGSSATHDSASRAEIIECDLCDAHVYGITVPTVIAKWNTRAAPVVTDAMMIRARARLHGCSRIGGFVITNEDLRAALTAALGNDGQAT